MSEAKKFSIDGITNSQLFMDRLQQDRAGFERISAILRDRAGINLVGNDKNLTLMASRLSSVLKDRGLENYKQYLALLDKGDPAHFSEFISSMTTNTTQFFREPVHFDVLKGRMLEIMEEKKKSNRRDLRIWCSAASTGQEVYTMMMVILEQIPDPRNWDIRFLATDIDPEVLARAADGLYQDSEVNGVPELYRQKYFNRVSTNAGMKFQVKKDVRDMIRFATFNLLTERYPFQFPFDVIFCRNVLIYFDRPTAEQVIEKLGKALHQGGFLFLGHSETGMMRTKFLKNVSSAAYQRVVIK